jgi:predicted phage terminase large subunit-like protein
VLSESEQVELLMLLEARNAEAAQADMAEYARLVLEIEPAAHHQLMIDALQEVEAGLWDFLLIMCPPGSAKSTYGSVLFPSWYLGRNPNKCVIAASHTGELAERFGRKVRNLVGGTEQAKVFPKCKLSADSTAAGRWDTTEGGEYFAAGVGGSITGRRADLAIIDDPVKSREDADSETIREKQWAWWRDDLTTRLKPGAAVVLIMTRWHEDDLAGRLLKDLEGSKSRVKIIRLPMLAQDNDALGRNPGDPLWPEWFTQQMIDQAQREPRTWSALYQQEPRPIGGGEFKIEWMSYWKRQPAATNKVILVDPSSGRSKKRGDFTSMWVVGVGPDGNDYVLDGVRDRLNLTERTDALFALVRRYRPAAVGYEQYGLQADIEHIRVEQERQQYRFRIIELGGAVKKEDRIRRLIPSFQQGWTWMPESMIRRMSNGEQRDLMEDFKAEYLAFPVAAHDDAMDCLARKEEPEMRKYLVAPAQTAKQPVVQEWAPLDESVGY